jgi:hypothetical protein
MNTKALYVVKRIIQRVDFQFTAVAGAGINLAYGNAAGKFFVDVALDLYAQMLQFIVLGSFIFLSDNTGFQDFL